MIVTATFRDDTDTAVDPKPPVQVFLHAPDGPAGPFVASKDKSGVFVYGYTVESSGRHYVKITTADGLVAQTSFEVTLDRTK